jgi:hypothetical protein
LPTQLNPARQRAPQKPAARWLSCTQNRDKATVYYQRPTGFRFPDDLSAEQRRFAGAEARRGLAGLLLSLPVRWRSHPSRVADAELKPLQLNLAAACGLTVPRTLLTNDATPARKFSEQLTGPMIYKPLSAPSVHVSGELRLIYATEVDGVTLTDQDWQARLASFVDQLAGGGALSSPAWRTAFDAVPRHVFVPTVLTDDEAGLTAVSGHDPAQREAWLDLVYTDTSLVTQYLEHPSIRTVGDRPLPVPTSSSTMPSLMATMLAALDVADGQRVLEIGTGVRHEVARCK